MMRALLGKPKTVRAHELSLGHKLVVNGAPRSITNIALAGSLLEGNQVYATTEFGGRVKIEQFRWTDKVEVK